MQKIRVFLNSNAGQSESFNWEKAIRQRLFRSDIEIVCPETKEQFFLEIEKAKRDKIDIVISVGGDGTFHALIQKLSGIGITFLVLPAGTANDFARSVGVSHERKVEHALDSIRKGWTKKIDLISINDVLMATNGGLGIVSDVAITVNKLRKSIPGFRGVMSFAKQEIYGLMLGTKILLKRPRYYRLRIKCEQFDEEVSTPLLLVANQPCIAANFPVAPGTDHADGSFNVTIFLHKNSRDFISSVYRIRQGVPPEQDPFIRSFETNAVSIESMDDQTLSFIGDGELLSEAKSFQVGIRPGALCVFTETLERIGKSDFSDAVESA